VLNLTFMGPCIADKFPSVTNKMQRYIVQLFIKFLFFDVKELYFLVNTKVGDSSYCFLALSVFSVFPYGNVFKG
jgi:hypothetical protein